MFTGLVEGLAKLVQKEDHGPAVKLWFDFGPNGISADQIGDSIAFNGCCLTVVEARGNSLAFEAGSETLSRTNLGVLDVGDVANYERALRTGDRMGGHYVTGHVDGPGKIERIREESDWRFFHFSAEPMLLAQMAPKGSICVDGISLTLVEVGEHEFSVALIPHTLEVTNLGSRSVGDIVNLETDVLAKYVARQVAYLSSRHSLAFPQDQS